MNHDELHQNRSDSHDTALAPKILLKQSTFAKVLLLGVHSLPAVQPFSMENKRKTNNFLARFVSQFKRKFNLKFDPHALVILGMGRDDQNKVPAFLSFTLAVLISTRSIFPRSCLVSHLLNYNASEQF